MAKIIRFENLHSKIEADHVLITMVRIENDARTLNLAKALLKRGDSVLIIGLDSENNTALFKSSDDITLLTTKDLSLSRAYQLWFDFHKTLLKGLRKVKASYWWALDIYVLPITLLFGKIDHAKILYDSREIYSGLGENVSVPIKNTFLKWIETIFIREVDKAYTSGKMDSELISELYQIKEPDVILNVPELIDVAPTNSIRERFDIPKNATVMLYQGLVGPGRGLKQCVNAVKELKDVHFCIVGNGIWLNPLKQLVIELQIESRVHFTGWVPYKNLLEWTASTDIGIVTIESYTKSLEYALPNKLFEYAMAKKPVIASDVPQMKQIVEKYDSGELISSKLNEPEIIQAIKSLMDETRYLKCVKGAEEVRKWYNWEHESKKIDQFLFDLA